MGQHLPKWSDDTNNNTSNSDNNINNRGNKSTMDGQRPRRAKRRQYYKRIPKELCENDLQQITYDCLDLIFDWFPELHERTYFLPPVHMNTVTYKSKKVTGVYVQEVQVTAESDWRDDEVMQRVLHCLRRLTDTRKEAMVVLLQMQHDNYMNKPCYSAAAAKYPRPVDLPKNLRRGDFDLLFLHRDHGLIVAEIKSVGWRPGEQQDDATVVKKVQQAVQQLNKADTVLTHLVSDLQPTPGVRKTLILPNVSSHRLQTLLEDNSDLAENICSCFNVKDVPTAVSLCLCSDQMTSVEKPSHVTDAILEALQNWWCRLVGSGGISNSCTPEVYELLIARFCGPASTVHVYCVGAPRLEFRTLGDAVAETGERMVQFSLFPDQLAMLECEDRHVYLTGPPGTGKTLVLILVAIKWVRRGHVVHVASTASYSEAATQLVYYQVVKTLSETDPDAVNRVRLHLNGNSRDNQSVVTSLLAASEQNGQLFVVCDEVDAMFGEFFTTLTNNVADLHLWAATYHHKHRPEAMKEESLTACLRSPPTVMRRMETAVSFSHANIYQFNDVSGEYLAPTDGPPELYLSHEGHSEQWAMDCEECGHAIADCLVKDLHVGKARHRRAAATTAVKTPPALQYRDVMVIPDWYQDRGPDFHDDVIDPASGDVTRPASGIVRGMRAKGLPVKVVTSSDSDGIRDLARAVDNAVSVVGWGVTNGLERKVVVSVGEGRQIENVGVSGVLHGASRCTSQLIYVRCPE